VTWERALFYFLEKVMGEEERKGQRFGGKSSLRF